MRLFIIFFLLMCSVSDIIHFLLNHSLLLSSSSLEHHSFVFSPYISSLIQLFYYFFSILLFLPFFSFRRSFFSLSSFPVFILSFLCSFEKRSVSNIVSSVISHYSSSFLVFHTCFLFLSFCSPSIPFSLFILYLPQFS